MSQTEIILGLLQRGPVTVPVARQFAGCERLAARINDLRRAGHQIETVDLRLPSGKVVAEYHLRSKNLSVDR
jgi:hypothetical protein